MSQDITSIPFEYSKWCGKYLNDMDTAELQECANIMKKDLGLYTPMMNPIKTRTTLLDFIERCSIELKRKQLRDSESIDKLFTDLKAVGRALT